MRLIPIFSIVLLLYVSSSLFAQEWIEFASREDRFTCLFPSSTQGDANDLPIGTRSGIAGTRL